jgi:hypothetical protein
MTVNSTVSRERRDDVVAGVQLSCAIKTYDPTTIRVFYGLAELPAEYGTDFVVALDVPGNYDNVYVTPTAFLLGKIANLIALDPDEENVIWIERNSPLTNDFSQTDGFLRERIQTEFDRTTMRDQELSRDIGKLKQAIADVTAEPVTATGVVRYDIIQSLAEEDKQRALFNLGAAQRKASATITPAGASSALFTNIPSWARAVEVVYDNVSLSSTETSLLQLGTAEGLDIGDYVCTNLFLGADGYGVAQAETGGFVPTQGAPANFFTGVLRLTNTNANVWVATGTFQATGVGVYAMMVAGRKTLDGPLTQIRAIRRTSAVFDAGSISVICWG